MYTCTFTFCVFCTHVCAGVCAAMRNGQGSFLWEAPPPRRPPLLPSLSLVPHPPTSTRAPQTPSQSTQQSTIPAVTQHGPATVAKISMFDFMVAAKAELEEHSARQTARLPLVGMSRGEGRCVWTRPRLLELCRTVLWSVSAEEEEEQASRLNEGTTGGPSSEEIAAQVSLSSIGASHGEPTVLANSVETVPNEGYCDGAAVLSIDEVLGHVLSASPSSAPSLSERLGVVMGGRDTADSCRLLAPLVGLNKSPSHPVYKLSFRAVEATKAAKNFVVNQLDRFALVRWGQRSLCLFSITTSTTWRSSCNTASQTLRLRLSLTPTLFSRPTSSQLPRVSSQNPGSCSDSSRQ